MRREQIINEVLNVYDDLGFERTSLRAVADAIGVTHPVLVHHFGTRERLFLEVLRAYEDRYFETEVHEGDPLAAILQASVRYSTRVPGLMALLYSMVARAMEADDGPSREYFVARYTDLRRKIEVILQSARAAGTVRDDVPTDLAATLVLAAADGLATQWLLDHDVDMTAGFLLLEELLRPPS